MRWVTVKIFFYWLVTRLSFRFPKLVRQNGKKYIKKDWEGGTFYYITYWWKGGFFNDALNLIRELVKISEERGKHEQVLGRFLNDEEWQLGIVTSASFNISDISGYKVEKDIIPAGNYAVLKGKGYPEHIFAYWFYLKRKLKRDHFEVISPTFEIYEKDTFNLNLPDKNRTGEIRYRIKESA